MIFGMRQMKNARGFGFGQWSHPVPGVCCIEEEKPPEGGGGEKPPEPSKAEVGQIAAIKAERERRQAAEAKIAEMEAAQEAARLKAAEEQGEFKKLYEESTGKLSALEEELNALRAEKAARLEAAKAEADRALEELPEDLRALVPDGLSPEAKLAQVRKVAALSKKEKAPTGTRGAGGGRVKAPEMSPQEANEVQKMRAQHRHMSEETALRLVRMKNKS